MEVQRDDGPTLVEDPLLRNSLREARFILILWACCCIYTVTYCYLFGYLRHEPLPTSTGPSIGELVGPLASFDRDPDSLTYPFGLGIPDWVFYGVVVPWGISTLITLWYVVFFFADDDLAPANESADGIVTEENEA